VVIGWKCLIAQTTKNGEQLFSTERLRGFGLLVPEFVHLKQGQQQNSGKWIE
jgi:hypothetical protein